VLTTQDDSSDGVALRPRNANKKGRPPYLIPFEMTFHYTPPQIDSVPVRNQVTVQADVPSVTSIEAAIEWYLAAHQAQFMGQDASRKTRAQLMRFVEHLRTQQHSLQLADLTYTDGRTFLDALTNIYTGEPLSPWLGISYKSALRSFSCFLVKSYLIQEDVFFSLKVR
jgi:hypothetical protein